MENLRIGFDAKRAVSNRTGLGNYSRLVIDTLARMYPANEYIMYTPRTNRRNYADAIADNPNASFVTPRGAWKKFSGLWRIYSGITHQIIDDRIDLFHGLSNELPLDISRAAIPSVVTIHDLIFRRLPDGYAPIDRAIYDYKFKRACHNASRIIAISRRTRDDIVDLYGINPDKIDIVYQGCDPQFSRPVDEKLRREVTESYSLPDRYILAVGTVERRKNQLQAIRALPALPDDVKLLIVGGHNRHYIKEVTAEINRLRINHRVSLLTGVPFKHLPALYSMATIASYTSRYEGFGIPVIEALSAGCPVIAATGSCLEEAGGPGAIYVNPHSVDEYIDVTRRLLDSPSQREELVTAGRDYITLFSPDNFTRGLTDTYHRAINMK